MPRHKEGGGRRCVWLEFIGYCNVAGVNDMYRCRRRPIWLLVWCLCFAIAIGIMIVSLVLLMIRFFQYPIVTEVQLVYSTDVVFPAVTFCNLNPIKTSLIKKRASDLLAMLDAEKIREFKTKGMENRGKQKPENDAEQKMKDEFVMKLYNSKANYTNVGHRVKNMLVECRFQRESCDLRNFTRWSHPQYGNCFTFIAKKTSFQAHVGPTHGLSLTLYAEDDEYLPSLSAATGFQVQVHAAEYVPFPESFGFTISPGLRNAVAIRQQYISRQPWPYGGTDCGTLQKIGLYDDIYKFWKDIADANPAMAGAVNYTATACMTKCHIQMQIERCNCVDASMVTYEQMYRAKGNDAPRACDRDDPGDRQCLDLVMKDASQSDTCSQDCPQPCIEVPYDLRVTSSLWPREQYFEENAEAWRKQLGQSDNDSDIQTVEEARNILARLEVYYQELNSNTIIEDKMYSIWTLLSDIGGTIGLWCGLSMLGLLQIIELICYFIYPPADARGNSAY